MGLAQLTLKATDPEDGAYFINKTLTRIHGYLHRHDKHNIGLNFDAQHIRLYAEDKAELAALLADDAVKFDVERQIFNADWQVIDGTIRLYKRMHPINDIKEKARRKIKHLCDKGFIKKDDKKAIENKRRELLTQYKNHPVSTKKHFIINTQIKRFTIWVLAVHIHSTEFAQKRFNSYGLLSKQYEKIESD